MFKLEAENLHFTEGPRWHDNKLWFSDFYHKAVMSLDESGNIDRIVDIPNQPSGLGWLPNGDLIIVSMLDRKLMRFSNRNLSLHSDLSDLTPFRCNDMVIDKDGHAYVGNFGSLEHATNIKPTCLIHVTPEGRASIVAENLDFPNGTVITPDDRKVWAQMIPKPYYYLTRFVRALKIPVKEGAATPYPVPDGICLDDQMGIWVASPTTSEVVRYIEGGKITNRITTPNRAYACMLGGQDGKKLFVCTANVSTPEKASSEETAKIYSTQVDHSRAGCP